jgi:uncharacterized protein YndB with AHSA1/START domain
LRDLDAGRRLVSPWIPVSITEVVLPIYRALATEPGTNMDTIENGRARAVADRAGGELLAGVVIEASPERVFRALTSSDIIRWWVRPGVFDTREWSGDVRAGGRWRTSGVFRGQPYTQGGEFLEVDAPRKLVQTWAELGKPGTACTATYHLDAVDGGTRLTLRQSGFASPDKCAAFAIGWETSFERLAEILAPELAMSRT